MKRVCRDKSLFHPNLRNIQIPSAELREAVALSRIFFRSEIFHRFLKIVLISPGGTAKLRYAWGAQRPVSC
jgi:hypothetical protein